MRTQSTPDHVYLLDRMRGRYVDAGPATRTDRVLSAFSGGRVRIAPGPEATSESAAQDEKPVAASDGFESAASPQRQALDAIGAN